MLNYTIEFDPTAWTTYGCWKCPVCGVKFFAATPSIEPACHYPGCSIQGYDGLVYLYTATERDGYSLFAPDGFELKLKERGVGL